MVTTGIIITFLFLSTPSARRATSEQRPPCPHFNISIHALREEGDLRTSAAKKRT